MGVNRERLLPIKKLQEKEDSSLRKEMPHIDLKNARRISVEQYNQELDEAEAEIGRGECITQNELKKQMEKW